MSLFSALQTVEVPSAIPSGARSPNGAQAGLLYRAGDWEAAHHLTQDLETPEGYFWHGILHRYEQDWSNARYWFRRVGTHPAYPAIHKDAKEIALRTATGLDMANAWDPIRMIEWCERAVEHPGEHRDGIDQTSLTEFQVAEWRRLFEWCMG